MKKYTVSDFQNDFSEEENYFDDEDELSFIYSLTSAFDGNLEYIRLMGQIYSSHGYGVKQDCDKAAFWYMRGAKKGDLTSVVRLADLYCDFGMYKYKLNYATAFRLYEFAAKEGDIHAAARVGIMYAHGLGCEQDLKKAREFITAAAEENDKEACYEYACMLRCDGDDGWVEYLKKSAYMSYGKACMEMVKRFGGELDDMKYILYLIHAANDYSFACDPAEAQIALANCYLTGHRTKKDLMRAESYFKTAADEGSEEAKLALKKYFKKG